MLVAKNIINSFSHLFFPHVCAGCGSDVINHSQLLCLDCLHDLPFTNFESFPNNPIEKIFWGRINVMSAASLLYFTKNSSLQNIIHQFKYKGKKEIGFYFGKMMGNALMNSKRFENIDAIIPLPLFISKEKRRGYNQATILCEGISDSMNVEVLKDAVIRSVETETQTKKNRIERWLNIDGKFELRNEKALLNKHVLLVDDIITTGATLEACAAVLNNVNGIEISIATLACTHD
ncbi:MAG TPA: phosphoribosyltransferase family protein [Puia sp.]|nr:phosphoribosyltransferase family protein [Puia sp.]